MHAYSRQALATGDAEVQVCAAAQKALAATNSINPNEWTVRAFFRATDARRVPLTTGNPLGGEDNDGGGIVYMRLSISGRWGTVAVGDSYAFVPNGKANAWEPLMLTGKSRYPRA